MNPLQARPPPNPLPKNFRANEYCDYHQGAGHKTVNCWTLKNKIQDLVDNGTILPVNQPNINSNPLPNHGVNAVITKQGEVDPFELLLQANDIYMLKREIEEFKQPNLFEQVAMLLDADAVEDFASLIKTAKDRLDN